jgi:hypothetical protein
MASGDGTENGQENQYDQDEFADQAEHLGQYTTNQEDEGTGPTRAVQAIFVTPLDPVIETEDGGRLPVVPVDEAVKLNRLKEKAEAGEQIPTTNGVHHGTTYGSHGKHRGSSESRQSEQTDAPLREAIPPSR